MRRLGLALLLAATTGCPKDEEPVSRKTIGVDGGQISSHDRVLTLLFQPGSLPGDTEIEIRPSSSPPMIFGAAYRVKPDIDLEVPVDVTYVSELPPDSSATAVAAIRRADFEAGNGNWVGLPITESDAEAGLVAGIDSEIALFYGVIEDAFVDPTTTTTTDPDPSTTTGEPDPTTTGDPTDTEDPDTGEETEAVPLSYATDIEPIFISNCTDAICHAAGAIAPNLAENGYDAIINVPSLSASASLIVPSDSAASYLTHKLDATHNLDTSLGGCGCNGIGLSMPQGQPLLNQDVRNRIREWINTGAAP